MIAPSRHGAADSGRNALALHPSNIGLNIGMGS
jgi:hypothetical protein